MKRRSFALAAGSVLAGPATVLAQRERPARVGSVYVAAAAITQPYEDSFLSALGALGFQRGRNLIYDVRHCDGDPSRLPGAVAEVIALKPDLLVGIEQVARVMRRMTSRIPIVLSSSTDPVAAGLARSLARPGGNVTGMAALNDALGAKSVELLAEIVPGLKVLAVLLDPEVPAAPHLEQRIRQAAQAKGIAAVTYWVKDRAAIEQAYVDMSRERPGGIVNHGGSGMMFGYRHLIAQSALRLQLPYAGASAEIAEAGALLSYAASLHASFRQAASHASRILNGADPGELAIEQPTEFELVINLRTAKALGLSIPHSLLVRANRVIE